MSTPVRSGYYGVGVGIGVGVGVPAAQLKSDSTRFPGRFVCAFISVQLPVVSTTNCWLPFGLIFECGHCLDAAAEGCYERPRRLSRADLVVDEVPGAGPIARGADIAGVQVRRTRRSHQLMMRYCDQGEHGQQQREICGSFHMHPPMGNLLTAIKLDRASMVMERRIA